MSIPTPPTPFVLAQTFLLDDEGTFAGPTSFSKNVATNKWTFGVMSIHHDQLDACATAIEQLLLQDFAAPLEAGSFNVDAAFAGDGVTELNAAFSVSLSQVNDAPGLYAIGTAANTSVGLAWSLCTCIRVNLGIGTPYSP